MGLGVGVGVGVGVVPVFGFVPGVGAGFSGLGLGAIGSLFFFLQEARERDRATMVASASVLFIVNISLMIIIDSVFVQVLQR